MSSDLGNITYGGYQYGGIAAPAYPEQGYGTVAWGDYLYGRPGTYSPLVVDLSPSYHIEIRSQGGQQVLAIPRNILDVGYNEVINRAGNMWFDLPSNDDAWPHIRYGNEVWLYIKGELFKVYRILGMERGR